MRKIEGLHTAIATIISEYEDEHREVIDRNRIVDDVRKEVDVHSASREWLEENVLRQAASIGLNDKGYRSVVRGKGLYVNLDVCNKPEFLARLYNNAKLSEVEKQKVTDLIKGRIKCSGVEGQLMFDMDGSIVEDKTEKQLLEMLEKAANE